MSRRGDSLPNVGSEVPVERSVFVWFVHPQYGGQDGGGII